MGHWRVQPLNILGKNDKTEVGLDCEKKFQSIHGKEEDPMSLLDKIPSWVAFAGLILVGAAMVIIGIFLSKTAQLGFIDFGSAVIIIGIVSWLGGATGKIKGRVGKIGLKVAITNLSWWVWIVNMLVLAAAIVIFLVAG